MVKETSGMKWVHIFYNGKIVEILVALLSVSPMKSHPRSIWGTQAAPRSPAHILVSPQETLDTLLLWQATYYGQIC